MKENNPYEQTTKANHHNQTIDERQGETSRLLDTPSQAAQAIRGRLVFIRELPQEEVALMASVPTTMASFMAAERSRNPRAWFESDEEYRQRLYQIARPSFEAYMQEKHVKYVREHFGEQADFRDRLAREKAGFDFNKTVRELQKTVLPLDGETRDQHWHRIMGIARDLEAASYGEDGQRKAREAAAERREARFRAAEEERAVWEMAHRPMTVREELNHPKQKKIQRAAEKYAR